MDTAARYSSLFVGPERIPSSYWTSLRYFNLYRIAVAALFLSLTVVYGNALTLGSHQLELFRVVAGAYLVVGIVLQAVVPVLDQDTETTLSDKILKEEHRIYSEAVKIVLEGKYKIEGRRVLRAIELEN